MDDVARESKLLDDNGDSSFSSGTRISWDTVEHIRHIEPKDPPSLEISHILEDTHEPSITLLLLLLLLLKSDFTLDTT